MNTQNTDCFAVYDHGENSRRLGLDWGKIYKIYVPKGKISLLFFQFKIVVGATREKIRNTVRLPIVMFKLSIFFNERGKSDFFLF